MLLVTTILAIPLLLWVVAPVVSILAVWEEERD